MKFIKNNINLFTTLSLVLLMLVVSPNLSFAQSTNSACNPAGGRICDPLGKDSKIETFLTNILEAVLKIALPLIVLAIIYCGFLFVMARGNPEELTKAKQALLYTVIGAAILLGAMALALVIKETVIALGK